MRAALRLNDQRAPLDTPSVIDLASKLIETDPEPMHRCYEARRTQEPLSVSITDPLVEGYTDFVRRLSRFIDQIPD
jgi:hypothetical protein